MVYGVWWITTVVIIRPSQPSLAGVGAGAELGNIFYCFISCFRLVYYLFINCSLLVHVTVHYMLMTWIHSRIVCDLFSTCL